MKTFTYRTRLALDDLALVERPLPHVGPREVLVRVDAVSLEYRDLAIARGTLRIACDEPGRRYRVIGDEAEETVEMGEDGLVETWHPRFLRDRG